MAAPIATGVDVVATPRTLARMLPVPAAGADTGNVAVVSPAGTVTEPGTVRPAPDSTTVSSTAEAAIKLTRPVPGWPTTTGSGALTAAAEGWTLNDTSR